jgi:threonine/homoserine/homoserine lactone efflux protein
VSGLSIFLVALVVSFVGSIPPGSINITTLQYALNGRKWAALAFALAAAAVEFFYAGLAVKFQIYLTENIHISNWFKWITSGVLIVLGIYNLFKKPSVRKKEEVGEKRNAFLKGVLIAATNPLAIPFWLVVTAYLDGLDWIELNDDNFLNYVAGVSSGTFLLLFIVTQVGGRFTAIQHNAFVMYRIPGIVLIAMGIWTMLKT